MSCFQLFSDDHDHLGGVHPLWQLGVKLDLGHSLRWILEQVCQSPWCVLDQVQLLAVRVAGLHSDGRGHLEIVENDSYYHP